MQLPFEILHIHKGETLEAFEVVNETDYLRIVTLSPLRDTFVVTSNLDIETATLATYFTVFEKAYAEYYHRICVFLVWKGQTHAISQGASPHATLF